MRAQVKMFTTRHKHRGWMRCGGECTVRTTHFVGRVGGLAAALGVGVAVWIGAPVASADDMTAGNSSKSPSSSSESTAGSLRSGDQTRQTHKKRRVERTSISSRVAADDPGTSTNSVAATRRRPAPSTQRDNAGEPATSDSAESEPPEAARASESVRVAPVLASSESAHPSGDDYGGSMASPVSWVLAAAARRELGGVDAAQRDTAATAGVTVVGRVTRTGHQTTSAEFNADGSRASVTTSGINLRTGTVTTRVSVFDTNTGRQIGRTLTTTTGSAVLDTTTTSEHVATTITLDGESSPVLNPDGTRALTTTGVTDSTTGAKTTLVTVYDTATGSQVGGITSLTGEMWTAPVLFGADGAHALITTATYDGRTSTNTMLYSTIDTDTGFKAGTTLALTGYPVASPVFSNEGKHVVFTTYDVNGNTYTTQVGVIDTTNGTQIGSTLAFSGVGGQYSPIFSDDGARVLILNSASEPPKSFSTRASVVSTITGAQIGRTLTFAGSASGVLSADGAHALIIAVTPHWLTLSSTTRVSILRIA